MIKGKIADILLSIYILGTLYIRFALEDALQNHPILSISLGAVMLGLVWAVIKLKWLQPNYFGLLNTKKEEQKPQIQQDDESSLFI